MVLLLSSTATHQHSPSNRWQRSANSSSQHDSDIWAVHIGHHLCSTAQLHRREQQHSQQQPAAAQHRSTQTTPWPTAIDWDREPTGQAPKPRARGAGRGAREPRHGGRVLYVSGVDGGRERGGDADSECDARGAGGIAPAVYFAYRASNVEGLPMCHACECLHARACTYLQSLSPVRSSMTKTNLKH